MSSRDDEFWDSLAAAGRDVLIAGKTMGYGSVVVEIKFADGVPMVAITKQSTAKRYLDADEAEQDIARTLNSARSGKFNGSQQFSVQYNSGVIKRVVVDEAASQNLS